MKLHVDEIGESWARMLGMGGEAPDNFADVRHFFFRGHDAAVEVLAEDCAWTFVP